MTLTVFKSNRSPSLSDTITIDGVAFNLTGSTVKLQMRLSGSNTLKVDAAAVVVSAVAGTVRYDWAAIDVDTPGMYVAWWRVTLPSALTQDTPEFVLIVEDHAPASSVDMCTIADVQTAFGTPSSDAPLVQSIITAASRAINSKYNREFTPLTAGATRTFRADSRVLDFGYADLRTATTVTLDPNGSPLVLVAGTDFKPLPIGASAIGTFTQLGLSRVLSLSSTTAWNFGFAEVSILGDWGAYSTATIPDELRRAAVETVGSWLDRAVKEYASTASLADTDFATRPDRFSGWGIPTSAHRTLSEHERVTV